MESVSKGGATYPSLWSSAKIIVQKDRNSKSAAPVNSGELYAILVSPDRNEALATLLADEANFKGVGEKDGDAAFNEWAAAVIALAPSISGAPAAKVQQKFLTEMQSAEQQLSAGIARRIVLDRALKYVDVSLRAFPRDERQEKARAALLERKASLDRRIAILRAFSVASMWDEFLEKYGDFERWENSYDDLKKVREGATEASANYHLDQGRRLEKEKQYTLALAELQVAKQRRPGDAAIIELIDAVKLREARAYADSVKRVEDRNSDQYRQVRSYLLRADQYIGAGQLDEAERNIASAVRVDKDSPMILLSRAKLDAARKQFLKALETVDQYDRRVTAAEDRDNGQDLRAKIEFDLAQARKNLREGIADSKAKGDYLTASAKAEEGLAIDGNDLEFLLEAAVGRAILRKNAEAVKLLETYRQVAQARGADPKKREAAYEMTPKIQESIPEPEGAPNWFSGYKSPAGVFYCPISLMTNARPAEVRGSRKQTSVFNWGKDGLSDVRVTSEQQGERSLSAYFEYFGAGKGVRRVATEALNDAQQGAAMPRLTPKGPIGAGKGVYTALLNHPGGDPVMIEKLTGKRVGAIVAGNPYFHPFIWDGVHSFSVEYDKEGRVKSAQQILGEDQKGTAHAFEFRWEGRRLTEIAERGTGDYRRTMTYAGGKLMSETIAFRGKTSKIEYKYKGDQLVEASCGDDPVDGRSRQVTFR